ncbi:MAG: hypothetical protein DRN96_07040 [Thermoproteota archaeon]|nr:MAG: hypothetical protein DRN96_07040 [Candidatus Korarchaeota archaeon]RLG51558.1 MAG: hypothetical protein DRN99_08435 [Candidatus Korarchaeota archaeon]
MREAPSASTAAAVSMLCLPSVCYAMPPLDAAPRYSAMLAGMKPDASIPIELHARSAYAQLSPPSCPKPSARLLQPGR